MYGSSREHIMQVTCEEILGPLNEIEKRYAPLQLYIAGKRDILESGPRVSIIGSRRASENGLENTRLLVQRLVKHQVVIVSGLALGIDTIAHKTAINECGKTIAVIGTPLDQCYPQQNCDLQKEIMRNHLAISQFPSGHPIQRKNFPMRNRTMALISHASIIVEASDTSGSLSQGWEALRLGRPLLILDANRKLKWPQDMTKYGATILSITQIKNLLDILPASGTRVDVNAAAL